MQVAHRNNSMARSKEGNRCNDPVKATKPNCGTNFFVTKDPFLGKIRHKRLVHLFSRDEIFFGVDVLPIVLFFVQVCAKVGHAQVDALNPT